MNLLEEREREEEEEEKKLKEKEGSEEELKKLGQKRREGLRQKAAVCYLNAMALKESDISQALAAGQQAKSILADVMQVLFSFFFFFFFFFFFIPFISSSLSLHFFAKFFFFFFFNSKLTTSPQGADTQEKEDVEAFLGDIEHTVSLPFSPPLLSSFLLIPPPPPTRLKI